MMDIGEWICERRKELGMGRNALSRKTQADYRTIYQIETGINAGNLKTLQKLVGALGGEITVELRNTVK